MRYGVDIPNFGRWADPREVAQLAVDVEAAGWDGLAIWDHILVQDGLDVGDPWIALAAAAARTERIKLIVAVTPIPRRTPWKLAREVVSLDHLSGGRFILGVGIGWPNDPEFTRFHGPLGYRERADMLDEGLAILEGLWSGEPFGFTGEYYQFDESQFAPTPVQKPRVPIWVAGMWPNRRPFRRAARYDGAFPIFIDAAGEPLPPTPEAVEAVASYIDEVGAAGRHRDLVITGMAYSDDPVSRFDMEAMRRAGATWWLEQFVPGVQDHDEWLHRVGAWSAGGAARLGRTDIAPVTSRAWPHPSGSPHLCSSMPSSRPALHCG